MLKEFFSYENLLSLCLWIPVILLSISFHEFAHGWVAYRLGDPTAKEAGRLTLNPVKHFNLFGFLMMMIVHFGWATPVPVNPNYFKNPSKGMLYTALAGPAANMILALISSLLYSIFAAIVSLITVMPSDFVLNIIQNTGTLLVYMLYMNIGLAVFNLIPIYPLDGSRVLGYFMPQKYHEFMAKYGQYIQIAFMLLLICTSFIGNIISVVQSSVANLLVSMWSLPISWIIRLF